MLFNYDRFINYINNEFNLDYMPKHTINNLIEVIAGYGEDHFKDDALKNFLKNTVCEAFDIDDYELDRFFDSFQKRMFLGYTDGKHPTEYIKDPIYLYDSNFQDPEEGIRYSVAFRQNLRTNDNKWSDCFVLYQNDDETSVCLDEDSMFYIKTDDYFDNVNGSVDINSSLITDTPMVDATTLACRMEFSEINNDFLDQMLRYWNDNNTDDLIKIHVFEDTYGSETDYFRFKDKWNDDNGNDYFAVKDDLSDYDFYIVLCRSEKNHESKLLEYEGYRMTMPSHDVIESDFADYLSMRHLDSISPDM